MTDAAAPDVAVVRDDAWLSVIFRREFVALVRLAVCLCDDRATAEDVVQDAFLSLHRHSATLRDANAAERYLRVAVVNGCRSQVRRLVRERLRRRPALVAVPSSEERAIDRDEHARVFAAVQALPRRQREVVACRFYLELSEAQTAELLGITTGSVKTHTHRATRAVERALEVSA